MVGHARTYDGRFFGRRVNCEQVPRLPASIVARVLADPEEVPYLLVWKSPSNGTVQEAVRIVPFSEPPDRGGLDLGIDWSGREPQLYRFHRPQPHCRSCKAKQ